MDPTPLQRLLRGNPALVRILAEATGVSTAAVRHWRRRSVPAVKRVRIVVAVVEQVAGVRLRWSEIYPRSLPDRENPKYPK